MKAPENRFVLGLDLDMVVGDYQRAFAEFVARTKGIDPDSIGPQTRWSFAECPNWPIDSEQEFIELHLQAVEEGMFRSMLLFDEASDAVWDLADTHEVDIHIVTSRFVQHGHHNRVLKDTADWLDVRRPDGRHRIPFRHFHLTSDKTTVLVDASLDDSPNNIYALRAAGRHAIVFDQPYNRDVPGPRVHSWPEAVDMIGALAAEHRLVDD